MAISPNWNTLTSQVEGQVSLKNICFEKGVPEQIISESISIN